MDGTYQTTPTASVVSQYLMRAVGGLQAGHLVLAQGHVECGDRVLEVTQPARPDDRGGHPGLAEQPCQGDPRRRESAFGGDPTDRVDDVEVIVAVQVAGIRVVARP